MVIKETKVEGETLYLKKDVFGWRIVHPHKNNDGSWNWENIFFGGKRNLFFLVVILIIMALLYLGVDELITDYKLVVDAPCDYCTDCFEQTRRVLNRANTHIDIVSDINLSKYIVEGSLE